MHKKTYNIIKNLGFDDEVLKDIKLKRKNTGKQLFAALKKLGLPDSALKQIRSLENFDSLEIPGETNQELLKNLLKKCKRSLDAFANKQIIAKIVFSGDSWVIYSDNYSKEIEKLQTVCKQYFDIWAKHGLKASFYFDGSTSWKIIANKKEDLPTNENEKEDK